MDKTFMLGLAIGMVGGAILAVNSKKVKELVEKGGKEVKEKLSPKKKDENAEDEDEQAETEDDEEPESKTEKPADAGKKKKSK